MTLSTPILNAAAAAAAMLLMLVGTLQAATPEASPADGITVERLEIDGHVYSLSPDGQWLAGVDDDNRVCLWRADSLEASCGDEPMPVLPWSFVWTPDSSAVAWSLDTIVTLYESDIYVHEVATSTTTNLTDDGAAGGLFSGDIARAGMIPNDYLPTWSTNGQSLTFVRTMITDGSLVGTQLMTVPRSGGEPQSLGMVSTDPVAIWTPMFRTPDDTLIYSMYSADSENRQAGIWTLAPGGSPERPFHDDVSAEYPNPVLVAATSNDVGALVSGYSTHEGGDIEPFLLVVETGQVVPVSEIWADTPLGPAGFSPDGTHVVALSRINEQPMLYLLDQEHGAIPVPLDAAPAGGSGYLMPPIWASNQTILLPDLRGESLLVTLPANVEQMLATPAPVPDCGCIDPDGNTD